MTEAAAVPVSSRDPYNDYLGELVRHGILIGSGVPGVYGKGSSFEAIVAGLGRLIDSEGASLDAECLRFPPVMSRADFERSHYLESFPHFAGCVHAFTGTERNHRELLRTVESGGNWGAQLAATDVVLTPAACYPLYPLATGTLPDGGRLFNVQSYCFRHEPSEDPARMQVFRQHEFVRMGEPDDVASFRDFWLAKAHDMLRRLGIEAEAVIANDPFFGRAGTMLAVNQVEKALKFELVAVVANESHPTAIVSCNYHQSHFGDAFGIRTADGAAAHTACGGFGLERITLALYRAHGFHTREWPSTVVTALGL